LLIKTFVTWDEGLALLCRVLLAQVPDQAAQDWRVPRSVGVSHGIVQSPEESSIVLVMRSRRCRFFTAVAFIERELYVNRIVAL
jgi:hypothetical protein